MKFDKLLSQVALNVTPYQWEEDIPDEALRFDTNTMPYPPMSLTNFLKSMINNCSINEYQDPNYTKLKELIADYEGVKKDMISVTNSGDEAIDILAKAFLNPGDYFITTPPTYEMYKIQCEVNRGKVLEVPLKAKDFSIDSQKILEESNKNKVKVIFICNPNNPTATVSKPEDIEKVIKKANSIVVVDEVYREFYGESVASLLPKYKNLVILRSFSKFAAMAGARIGYLLADPELVDKFESIRFPMGVSFLSYKLAETVLSEDKKWMKDQIEMIKKERKRLSGEFCNLGFYVYPSYANFLLVKIGDSASSICIKLKEKGVIVRNRSKKKYLAGCIRITVRSPKENDQLLKYMKEILNEK